MCDVDTLRLFVNERLSAAAEDIFTFFIRTLELYHQHPDFFPVCEDQSSAEQQHRSSSVLHEEPEPPLIKEEQEDEELLQRPEEADWLTMTSPAVKHDDGNHKCIHIRETEAVASTSSQYMGSVVADEDDCGTSPLCCQSDPEAIDDLRTTQSTLNRNTAEKENCRRNGRKGVVKEIWSNKRSLLEKKGELADFFPVCEDQSSAEQQHRSSSVLHEEPEPPLIKEEQEDEELLQRPEEADWPTMTSPAVKHDDGNHKYIHIRETEAVASTSSQYMGSVVADEDDCGTSPLCCQSDPEAIDDLRTTQSTLNRNTAVRSPTLDPTKSYDNKTQNVEGQRWCLTNKSPQGPAFSQQVPFMRSPAVVEKPFSCTVCDKRYGGKSDLKRHMRTHTGEKPFSCAICGKCFGGKTVLKRHIGTHTGEKPFSCPVCGKRFNRNETMKRHMITHTGERPFSCMVCGKCFGLNAHLKTHMRTHTGEKAFVVK